MMETGPTQAEIGSPPPSPLPKQTRSGSDALGRRCEPVTATPETAPDLVSNEQCLRFFRQSSELAQKGRGRYDAPAAPENGLDEHRADIAAVERLVDDRQRDVEIARRPRIRRETTCGLSSSANASRQLFFKPQAASGP